MIKENAKKTTLARKKRWNKNKKKNWRQKIDLTEVEEGLEKQRLELRTGGLVGKKSNNELFVVEKKPLGTQQTVKSIKNKVLMVDKIINPDGGSGKEASRRNVAKFKRWERKRKLLEELKKPKLPTIGKTIKSKNDKHELDIWSQSAQEVADKLFGETELSKYTTAVVGKVAEKRPSHMYAKPAIPASSVQVAHPGSSYNPTYDAHQTLLNVENAKEESKVRAENKIERAVYVDPTTLVTAEMTEKEMREGLFDEEESVTNQDETEDKEEECDTIVPQQKRKSRQAKKRELLRKEMEKEKQAKWVESIQQNEVFRVKTFLSEIKQKEKRSKEKQKLKSLKEKQPRLSYMKFEEPDQDLQLSSEIKGSLRQLKPEGNIMFDRYKSLQKRCIIEPRQKFKAPRRKYRVKYQEKRCFREITLD